MSLVKGAREAKKKQRMVRRISVASSRPIWYKTLIYIYSRNVEIRFVF